MTGGLLGGADKALVSHDLWVFLGIVVAQFAAIVVAVVQGRTAAADAKAAKQSAQTAAELSKPTGNGFADDVRQGFSDLREGIADMRRGLSRVEAKIDDHVADHARSDILGSHRPRRVQ